MLEPPEAAELAEALYRQGGLVFCLATTAIVTTVSKSEQSASLRVCHLDKTVYLSLEVGGREFIFALGGDGIGQIATSLTYHRDEAGKTPPDTSSLEHRD